MTGERILNGRYIVGELIGRGGMADVHLGVDQVLGRKVAIKLLRPEMARDPMVQARFRREAKAVAGLNHPNIVSVYDTGEEDREINGSSVELPFIVMEYVSGRTLRDLHKAGEITVDLAVDYVLGVLEALQHSHAMGIVHRDIKPANIMVTSQGALKVMDFGIARALADSSSTMTQTQTVVGTAQYLSPEQARGEMVDARTDLYSTGCLLYELLTGRPPFTGDSPVSVAYQHVGEHAPAPSSLKTTLPPIYDDVVLKALAKDREDRYADAHGLCRGLAQRPQRDSVASRGTYGRPAAGTGSPRRADTLPCPRWQPSTGFHTGYLEPVAAEQHWNEQPMWEQGRSEPVDDYRAKSKKAWTVVLSIIMVLALAVGGLFFYNWMQAEAARNALVTVPSLTNLTQAEAESTLTRAGARPQAGGRLRRQGEIRVGGFQQSRRPGTGRQGHDRDRDGFQGSGEPQDPDFPGRGNGGHRQGNVEGNGLHHRVGNQEERSHDSRWILGGNRADAWQPGKVRKQDRPDSVHWSCRCSPAAEHDRTRSHGPSGRPQVRAENHWCMEEVHTVAEPGTIIGQDPESGSTSPQGGTVTVTVAKAPEVPPVTPPTATEESTPQDDSADEESDSGIIRRIPGQSFPGVGHRDSWDRGDGFSDD